MIIKVFLFWALGLFLVTFLGTKTLPLVPNSGIGAVAQNKEINYFLSLAQWDGGNYLHIAKEGFTDKKYFAFAPLYPLLLKLISLNSHQELLIGLMISSISFLLFLITLHNYLKQKYSKVTAANTLISYLVFPTSFFCLVTYSESLFLLLMMFSVIYLEKNKMLLSAVLAGVAALTRFIGIFFVVSQIYFVFKNKKFNIKNISFVFTLFPLVAYSLVLLLNYKNPFLFLDVQNQWGRFGQDPITTIFTYIWKFTIGSSVGLNDLLNFSATILFIGLLIKGINKIPGHLWIFSCLVVLIPASTGTLTGMPRYVLPSIGAFVILGHILGNSKLRYPIWALSLALQCFLASLFVTGHWVA